jgi:hypothetical protein
MWELLLDQGPITAAFFLLAGSLGWAIIYKGDEVLKRVESGYERNAAELLKVSQEQTKGIEALLRQWREDRALLLDVLRQDHEAIRRETADGAGLLQGGGLLDGSSAIQGTLGDLGSVN